MSTQQLKRMSPYPAKDLLKGSQAELGGMNDDAGLPGSLPVNPYCFLCDGIPVHISFVNEERELSKALVEYFCSLKS